MVYTSSHKMTDIMHHLSDVRQSVNYAKYLRSQGWIVERIKNTNYFIKKLVFLGSVLKIQRPETIDFETTKKIEEKYKVFQTIIEPLIPIDNYKLSRSPYLPSKTLHLDLTKPIVFKKETRRCIKIGDKQKIVEYSTPEKIEKFHNAWKKSVNFHRFVPSLQCLINLKKAFPNNHSIFLASHNKSGGIIGGAIFTRSSHDIAYYWYGFTNNEGRTSLSQYPLLYSGILWAKKQGCKVFDFEGIYDDRFPQRSWLGFTHFKKSFGGLEIEYPGCYTKYNWFRGWF